MAGSRGQEPASNELVSRDAARVWHPFTQMQTAAAPIAITRAEGLYLYDENGKSYIDAVSSWWVNLHGHAHPELRVALDRQFAIADHIIFAGFTHEAAVLLAETLLEVLPENQARVFYSDNGSTAVEVALKMAIQFHYNRGAPRRKVLALQNSYHGDTFGAMAVSSPSVFTAPYRDRLFEVVFAEHPQTEADLSRFSELLDQDVAAFIFEPLVQGSGGMKMHQPEILDRMLEICREKNVLSIADEVMTGFGRTGLLFASDYLNHKADIMCLSKGLTGGVMPMGITTCTKAIYEGFLSQDAAKTFFHGHSYTANPLACALAIASLEILKRDETRAALAMITRKHEYFKQKLQGHPGILDVRCRGTILAIEWKTDSDSSYFNNIRDTLYNFFLEKGILLRPLGNVIYIMAPYCIRESELEYIYQQIESALEHFK